MRKSAMLAVVAAMALAACGGGSGGVSVEDVRVGEPTGPNAALYFTATNDGDEADSLVGASTDVATTVELHETTMSDDGTMGMQPVESLEIAAGATLVLEPGGLHLMLIDADRMAIGDTIEVTLAWDVAGDMVVEAEVVEPGDTMDHGDMDMDEDDS